MPTRIGTDELSVSVRHQIMPEFIDFVYDSNPFFYRAYRNHRIVRGGTHIEYPAITSDITTGGAYIGYETFDVSAQDTAESLAFDWKHYQWSVTVDGSTLVKADSDLAIGNLIRNKYQQTRARAADMLGTDMMNDGSDSKKIIGFKGAVDDGGVLASYGTLTRSSNTFLNCTEDASTSTLTIASMQTMFGNCQKGGHTPTIILARQEQYNRFYALIHANQSVNFPISGRDDILGMAGFTNVVFNNVPFVVDSHVFDGPNTSNSAILFLNENWIDFIVSPRENFYMRDFITPPNQNAMTALILLSCALVVKHPGLQGKMTALTG